MVRLYKRGDIASRYIPENSRELRDDASDAVAYLSERNGVPYAIGYCGTRAKADFNERYARSADRDRRVQKYFESRRSALAWKAEAKAKSKAAAANGVDNGSIGLAEVSKMLKRRLQREFPDVRFSVRSESYSMGSSIDIRWTDGPTRAQVDAIAGQYKSRGFDGMIDLAYSYEHWLLPSGDIVIASNRGGTEGSRGTVPAFEVAKPHPDARRVSLHSGYVSCDRTISDGAKAGILAAWRELSPHERHKLWCKVRPDAGQASGPGGWPDSFSLEDGSLADFTDDQRAHIVWAIARDTPLPAARS